MSCKAKHTSFFSSYVMLWDRYIYFILFKCYFYLRVNQQLLPCLLCQSTHICHKYLFNYKKWCPHISYCLNFVQKCTCPQVVFIINYNMFLFSLTMTQIIQDTHCHLSKTSNTHLTVFFYYYFDDSMHIRNRSSSVSQSGLISC